MSISEPAELEGMKAVSEAAAVTLKKMKAHAKPGMSTKELDAFGAQILKDFGAKSAPYETYKFPGYTCISVNEVMAHGIPSAQVILKEGDLVNIDVSAELDGFWADNGSSFVLGKDIHNYQPLVDASRAILLKALDHIKGGVRMADVGGLIEKEAKKSGYKVIRNLAGHGVGRSLHEAPEHILNYKERFDKKRFKKNSVVAIETFIASHSDYADELNDGWTLVGDKGGVVCQHEHTIVITDDKPLILTAANGI